ncbi:MAG: hypothetical protein KUL82_10580 [Bdellovibrio sp.]|nr:hypothetical protein [Bdellovibrio sp.]
MKTAEFFAQVKRQNFSNLEKKASVSRQALYDAVKSRNMKLRNFESLAKAMNYRLEVVPDSSEQNVLASLKRAGAPVAYSGDGSLDLENAVALGLKGAHHEGLYESLVPYVLATNAERLDLNKLLGLAFEYGEAHVLGYFIEMANAFQPHPKFEKALKVLSPMRSEKPQLLVEAEKSKFKELFEKNSAARRWNFLVRGTLEDHLMRWESWNQSKKKT